MWSEAFEALARAERMHRQSFPRPVPLVTREPPVDILETGRCGADACRESTEEVAGINCSR
jgi:hypothetical protein